MAKSHMKPLSIKLTPALWDILDAEKQKRPYAALGEIARDLMLLGAQELTAQRTKTEAMIAAIEHDGLKVVSNP